MECCDDHLFVFILTLVILMMLKLWRDRRSYDDRLLRAERTIDTLRLLLAQTQSVLKIKSEFIVANEFRCKKKQHPIRSSAPVGRNKSCFSQIFPSLFRTCCETCGSNLIFAPLAQWIARSTSNAEVAGSNPVRSIVFLFWTFDIDLLFQLDCGYCGVGWNSSFDVH